MPCGILTYEDKTIQWSYPDNEISKTTNSWPSLPPPKKCPTLAEEVWAAVKLWYKEKGLPVPVEDATVCLKAIADEKKPAPPPVETKSKPSYGSGSYWKAYWDKKKAAGWVPKKVK